MDTAPRILFEASDVTPEIESAIEDCLDWFTDQARLNTEEFIDRLCDSYGGDTWDIENYHTPAVRRIMKLARGMREQP